MSPNECILFILIWTAILVVPLWSVVRAMGALFSSRLRRRIEARPILHSVLFLLSLSFFALAFEALNPHSRLLARLPTAYQAAGGDLYWRMMLQGTGREITRHEGVVFYFRGHHGPTFYSIAEAEVIRSRRESLRVFTDRIAFDYAERQEEPLARLGLLTQYDARTIESFCEGWRGIRDQFEFDPDADARYEQYQWTRYKLERRFGGFAEMEARERERITRRYYRLGA